MFGLTFPKLALIGIIAVVIIGPERLPAFAARLASFVKTLRALADTASERVREEMGPEFEDVDWKKLDPRQYDPRRIIREALLDDDPEQESGARDTVVDLGGEPQVEEIEPDGRGVGRGSADVDEDSEAA